MKKPKPKTAKPRGAAKSIDAYLAAVPRDARAALERLRRAIRAAAPDAAETISYGVPTFVQRGGLVSFAAHPNHCAFYVRSPGVMDAHAAALRRYDTSAGTIRFLAAKPLPAALVKKLVKSRIEENERPRR